MGLLLDSGHLTFAGGDPMRALKRHAKRIVHVHCKDIRKDKLAAARKQDMSFLDAVLGDVFAVPGDGSIDFDAVAAKRWRRPATTAGWWWRPTRTRPRRIR